MTDLEKANTSNPVKYKYKVPGSASFYVGVIPVEVFVCMLPFYILLSICHLPLSEAEDLEKITFV